MTSPDESSPHEDSDTNVEAPSGTAEGLLEARQALMARLHATSRDLVGDWGNAVALAQLARLSQALVDFLLEALHRASAATQRDPEALLATAAGPMASLSRTSLEDLAATITRFHLDDMPSDVRATVDDIKSARSTFMQLIELRGLVFHAARRALVEGPERGDPRNDTRDRFLSLARKLERLLSAEPTISLKQLLVVRDASHGAVPIGARFVLRGCLVVGRSSSCSVVVNDHDCSRRHARILELGGRGGPAVLYDESSNGTFLNGKRVDGTQLLADGDLIRTGGVEFRFLERLD